MAARSVMKQGSAIVEVQKGEDWQALPANATVIGNPTKPREARSRK